MTVARLYDKSMYEFERPESSIWEAEPGNQELDARPLEGDQNCAVAIIGGGYTGLSAAYHLGREFGIDCRVLEAGHIGWGASGRNAGFCSIGGTAADIEDLVARFGLEDVRAFYKSQVAAVRLVRDLIVEESMDAQKQGDAELEVAHSRRAFSALKSHAEQCFRHLKLDTSVLTAEQFAERYFDSTEQYGAAVMRPTFGLHPLRYLRGLAAGAQRHGAVLHPFSEVLAWTREGQSHVLRTARGSVRSRYVVFATNGFMPEHLRGEFQARSLPLISAIVVTRPLRDDELEAHRWQTKCPAINSRNLPNYFRLLPDNRFLFGGRGHSDGTAAGSERNYGRLIGQMRCYWPRWHDAEIEYRWHGFVCFTRRLTPSIGRLDEDRSVYYGFGYHGNGVNTATWAGKQLALWIGKSGSSGTSAPSLPAMVQGLSARFPLASLRRHYLRARIGWLEVKDRLGW